MVLLRMYAHERKKASISGCFNSLTLPIHPVQVSNSFYLFHSRKVCQRYLF